MKAQCYFRGRHPQEDRGEALRRGGAGAGRSDFGLNRRLGGEVEKGKIGTRVLAFRAPWESARPGRMGAQPFRRGGGATWGRISGPGPRLED